jgi:hypothetical protein
MNKKIKALKGRNQKDVALSGLNKYGIILFLRDE